MISIGVSRGGSLTFLASDSEDLRSEAAFWSGEDLEGSATDSEGDLRRKRL